MLVGSRPTPVQHPKAGDSVYQGPGVVVLLSQKPHRPHLVIGRPSNVHRQFVFCRTSNPTKKRSTTLTNYLIL